MKLTQCDFENPSSKLHKQEDTLSQGFIGNVAGGGKTKEGKKGRYSSLCS